MFGEDKIYQIETVSMGESALFLDSETVHCMGLPID
jgi:hypothetical protein